MIESNKVEFKLELTDGLEKEVIAFLNYKNGGDIYIGIDDNGNAIGVANADSVQLAIADRIKNNILPATLGLFDVVIEKHDGKAIVHIIVSGGPEKPYYIKKAGMSPKGCYIRVGASAQPMTTAQIDDLYARRTRNSLNRILSPRQSLTFEQLQIYYQSKGLTLNDKFAENLDLLTDDGRYNYIAYLLSDSNGISVKVAKYAGTDKVDLISNEEFGYCSLIKATNSVLDRLNIENATAAWITNKSRIEKRLVDPIALREAVINAVVHNDYTQEVAPVFEIYSDRLEITSYGGLVAGLSKEEFLNCRSIPRNRELMRVFKDVGLVEQLGSGMSRILRVYNETVFNISEHFLTVTFKFDEEAIKRIGDTETPQTPQTPQTQLSDMDKKVFDAIEANPKASQSDIAKAIGEDINKVKFSVRKLKGKGIIVREGTSHNGKWKVISE